MKKGFRWNKKGISTVIATIIIVAISIVMAIAVAYWALGIGGSFTRFEKLQFVSAYAQDDSTLVFKIKNTGTAAATIDTAFINGKPDGIIHLDTDMALLMQPGDVTSGSVTFTALPSGTTVQLTIQTSAGNQYPQVVVLP